MLGDLQSKSSSLRVRTSIAFTTSSTSVEATFGGSCKIFDSRHRIDESKISHNELTKHYFNYEIYDEAELETHACAYCYSPLDCVIFA